mmetsp:Transcript_27325/g.72933  ORF Transcript_27325/g.72933 Transcript_27325/m.72933 type:complete len:163 (+) Transcript_27325:437-925(+)
MCRVSVQVSSMKKRSCETTMTMRSAQVLLVPISCANHKTACMLRWFVGSSKKRMSGFANSAAAKATRTRQPPLSAFIVRPSSSSVKPRSTSIFLARAAAPAASMDSSWLRISRWRSFSAALVHPASTSASSRSTRRWTSAATTTWAGVWSSAPSASRTSWDT